MSEYKKSLGSVFVSYSSLDRTVTRKIVSRLKKEGFPVWQDEHQLRAGDSLAEGISKALAQSKAVVIIVSRNSIKSKWLKYELNIATGRMIQGECRVIPVVIEDVQLPPEVQGLLYADLRKSFRYGLKSIISSLEYEARKRVLDEAFYRQVDIIVDDVFGPRSYVSMDGEYDSLSYEAVSVPVATGEEEDTWITYETVQDYIGRREPLTDRWWQEYLQSRNKYTEQFHLVITQRPIGFPLSCNDNSSIYIHRAYYEPMHLLISAVVLVDLSSTKEMTARIEIIRQARDILMSLAEETKKRDDG